MKCTAPHGNAPSREQIDAQKELLVQELSLVEPKLTIAMGLLPLKELTGETIKLGGFAEQFSTAPRSIPSKFGPVVPCWFPVGGGNPKKATEFLSFINCIS